MFNYFLLQVTTYLQNKHFDIIQVMVYLSFARLYGEIGLHITTLSTANTLKK